MKQPLWMALSGTVQFSWQKQEIIDDGDDITSHLQLLIYV